MTALLVLRHGPTAWSAAARLQGRADPPLSDEGRRVVSTWRLPARAAGWDGLSSPLRRAVETARLLGLEPAIEPVLTELDWGEWEGRKLADIRTADPDGLARNEARGLDFRPPGGESYREVQERLAPFLARRAALGRPAVAVCHKGVLLALYALAVDWSMAGPPPVALYDASCHLFRLDTAGRPAVDRLNVALAR